MNEVKSVKVDNWGVFFLQKLQNFFNKTDYCDLTLQFRDNSQLKVHRLVLSACTDFFNVLETRLNSTDDLLVMPYDLQADVVVPIVNFMYTGTLEFEVSMYGRLLRTARDMNMTVLLKLLQAHKRAVDTPSVQQPHKPLILNKGVPVKGGMQYARVTTVPASAARPYTKKPAATVSSSTPNKKTVTMISTNAELNTFQSVSQQASALSKELPEPVQLVARYANSSTVRQKGPSRFECSDEVVTSEPFESSFDNISYESRPLITANQMIKEEQEYDDDSQPCTSNNSFEQLKKSYAGQKRASSFSSAFSSPPEKKPNIQDIKEYTEAHRMRKAIVSQEVDDETAPEYIDENYSDDDDEEYLLPSSKTPNQKKSTDNKDKSSNSRNQPTDVNHAKIISEVLKKYPHLVKNNKNIKLQIMQKEGDDGRSKPTAVTIESNKPAPMKPVVAKPTEIKTGTVTGNIKKIESKKMFELIAKGAENMEGPWLCLRCGVNGRPISIPSYRGFRRHLINIHHEKIDPKLCEHCGWRSEKRIDLNYHMFVSHSVKPSAEFRFPKCNQCIFVAQDLASLNKHRNELHNKQNNEQHCIYCNKTFPKELQLYAHMRNNHKERARDDGVIDFSDDDDHVEDDSDKYVPNDPELSSRNETGDKIKILSNITLPPSVQISVGGASNINLEPSSEAAALTTVVTGIATSLGVLNTSNEMDVDDSYSQDNPIDGGQYYSESIAGDTKFVTEEGSELELSDAQKAELIKQLNEQNEGSIMVLNDEHYERSSEPVVRDNSSTGNIMVVYSQTDDTEGKENVTEEHVEDKLNIDVEEEVTKTTYIKKAKSPTEIKNDKEKEIDRKTKSLISALEGDWSEDDDTEPIKEESIPSQKSPIEKSMENKADEVEKTEKSTDKLSTLIDDWGDDSTEEKTEEDTKKETKIKSEKKQKPKEKSSDSISDIQNPEVKDDETENKDKDEVKLTDDKDLDESEDNGKAIEKEKLNELKTLINDWGDDDDDEK